jgi:hypothetical protein
MTHAQSSVHNGGRNSKTQTIDSEMIDHMYIRSALGGAQVQS